MTVSPCEALINLRGRWLGGDQGLWPYADEDYGSISCGGEGTPQTFLPAIKATWLSSVALGKEKKRSPLRKEINYVLYAWQEIKTGHNEVENSWSFMLPLTATESGRAQQSRSQLQPWGEGGGPRHSDGSHSGRASAPSRDLGLSRCRCPTRRTSFLSWDPCSHTGPCSQEDPALGVMLCHRCLEFLNTF